MCRVNKHSLLMRERKRIEKDRQRQTDRQTDRQTEIERGRQIDRGGGGGGGEEGA